MTEELDIAAVLDKIRHHNLNPIERILAAHTGTVQLLLSLYFGVPVDVRVIVQEPEGVWIRRDVALTLRISGTIVCSATSFISKETTDDPVMDDVMASVLGLGQIAVKHKVQTTREIISLTVTPKEISRTYTMKGSTPLMSGPRLFYQITEVFPRELYSRPEGV